LTLRDAKIRSKLGLLLIVPLAAVVVLAGLRLVDSGQRAISAELVRSLTTVSVDVSTTTQELQKERLAAARFIGLTDKGSDGYTAQTKITDAAITEYHAQRDGLRGLPDTVTARLNQIDKQLETLNSLRQQVTGKIGITVQAVVARYTLVIDDLVAYHDQISPLAGDTTLANSIRAVAAFVTAKAQASQEQVVAYAALKSSNFDSRQLSSFLATLTGQQSALSTFDLSASPQQRALVDSVITGDAETLARRTADQVSQSVGGTPAAGIAENAVGALGSVVDLMRFAEQELDVGLENDARNQQNAVIREVVIESILVILALVLAVLLAAMVARSLVFSLSGLREGALSVAERDLPAAVARLRESPSYGENTPEEIVNQVVDPIKIDSRDEVGQVAQAFNVVHREAVRVAAEQAALRASVSAMFLNLARRSQTLVDRMIGDLDDIERSEEDPKRLSRLFQLDHLATRMRRNDENLLILAGADTSPPRREDALLVDVVRAAQSEVELYNRIEFATVDQDASVAALVVNDVVRLLAELLDNATRFSPPQSAVVVDARRIGDYVLLQIEDRGLGMTPDQMAMLNDRLMQPPTVDVAAFRMMGLAVVARLASRHGIKVELRVNPEGGTITIVTLPTPVLILPRLRGREPVLPRSRSMLAVERAPEPQGLPMPQLPGLASPPYAEPPYADEMSINAAGPGPAVNGYSPPGPDHNNGYSRSPERSSERPRERAPEPVNGYSQDTAGGYTQVSPENANGWSRTPEPQVADNNNGWSHTPDNTSTTNVGAGNGGWGNAPTTSVSMVPSAPVIDALGYPSGPQKVVPPADDTAELPIFRAMEAVWFRSHPVADELSASAFRGQGAPVAQAAGGVSAPVSAPPRPAAAPSYSAPVSPQASPAYSSMPTSPAPTAYVPPAASPPPPPPPTTGPIRREEVPVPSRGGEAAGQESWRTAADDGWRAAAAAAQPKDSGTTRSGLPKRVPAAQLVPGGVEARPATRATRRTPEEVRGLLSAYHRGVQRGRTGGDASADQRPADKETD
jgi:signal transduction histidine kinase